MKFEYYYGSQADQFTFIRIPKLLLTHEAFSSLSIQSKVLFGILLDRMSLSMKNGWTDNENRVYIIYQIQEIQEDLGFSKKKAMDYLNELEKIGLVEKKRRGLGLPSILYVKSFMSGIEHEIAKTGTSRSVDLGTSENSKYSEQEKISVDESSNIPDEEQVIATPSTKKQTHSPIKLYSDTESSITNNSRGVDLGTSRSVDLGTSRGAEIAPQEVPDGGPLNNNIKINNTNINNTLSNRISVSLDSKISDEIRADTYKDIICENIDYDSLLQIYPDEIELLDGIADLILEVIMNQSKNIFIASGSYPTELVRSRFLKLNSSHIQYVIECFNSNTAKIANIKKYLMAALFNAPATISGYYSAAVHHDLPYTASK